MVADLVDAVIWNVRHRDAPRGGGRDIDVVDADAVAGDDATSSESFDDPLGDRRVADEERVRIRDDVQELRVRRRLQGNDVGADRIEERVFDLQRRKHMVGHDDLKWAHARASLPPPRPSCAS